MYGGKSVIAVEFIGTLLVERPPAVKPHGHCEERSDGAIRRTRGRLDCFVEFIIGPATLGRTRWLAMTRECLSGPVLAGTRIGLERRYRLAIDRLGPCAQRFKIGVHAPDLAKAPAQNPRRAYQSESEGEDRHRHLRTLAAPSQC